MSRLRGIGVKVFFAAVLFMMMTMAPLTNAFAAGNSATSSATSAAGNVLRIGWTTEPDSLSPFITYDNSTTELFLMIYDPLVAIGNNDQPVPRLATSWQVSKDHLTWTFHLRKGVKWQDGVPFTSADVKYTYDTLIKSQLGLFASFENNIASVSTPNPYTVVIKTKQPKANMLQMTTPILPKHIWDKISLKNLTKWPNSAPIGTGAFQLVKWKKGQYIELKANKNYFLGKPKVDKIYFQLFANTATMAQAIKVGEIDAAIGINPDYYKQLAATKNVKIIAAPDFSFDELAFNSWNSKKSHGNPLLLNTNLRHAIDYAINKQAIIDVAYSGRGTVGSSIVPASYKFWHWQPPANVLRTYNPAQANKILNALGFTKRTTGGVRENAKGQKLDFRLYVRSASTSEVKAGEMIKDMLQKVGIKLNVQVMDDGLLNTKIYNGANYDMFIWGWGTDLDPTTILSVLTTQQIGNLSDSYFSNKQYDALFAKQQTILDPAARQKAVFQMQKIAYQSLPYDVLTYTVNVQAVRTNKFTGWKPIQGTYFFGFNNWNYLHVHPIGQGSGTASASKSSTSNVVIGSVIVLIVLVLAVLFFRRSRKKSDFDKD